MKTLFKIITLAFFVVSFLNANADKNKKIQLVNPASIGSFKIKDKIDMTKKGFFFILEHLYLQKTFCILSSMAIMNQNINTKRE